MPTVLIIDGYLFRIYLNDHPPAHVHVLKAENEARVTLVNIDIMSNIGFNTRELSRIKALVEQHHQHLLNMWDSFHESR
jgi:3-methyladenine DNA glycosylase AlkD